MNASCVMDVKEVKMVEGDADLARKVFQRAYNDLKSKGLKSEVCDCFGNLNKQSSDWWYL